MTDSATHIGSPDACAVRLPNASIPLPPYKVVMKPYGQALVALAKARSEVLCLGADLTRQTETDLFREIIPERFVNIGMAEANMIGIAGGLARAGHVVFANTFGVFCTRRCYDQLAMAVAYPSLNVNIVGFMPGLSSPGGPSHQALEDIALMRALPNMAVLDLADATEIEQAAALAADRKGPVYLRLKRGEIPVIFGPGHTLEFGRAHVLSEGEDVAIVASGMMVPSALVAADVLQSNGLSVTLVNSPSIKPLDVDTIVGAARRSRVVITAENHSVIGGLGSAVAEAMAEAGVSGKLRRIGVQDVFAESGSREFLFEKYGLDVSAILRAVWSALGRRDPVPPAPAIVSTPGTYSPV
jgi:transketolase